MLARRARWGPLRAGYRPLLAQPAWFYAIMTAEQWGVVAVSVVYTIDWLRGLRNFWLRQVPA